MRLHGVVVYASEGRELHALALDPVRGTLTPVATAAAPEVVQYAAIDAARHRLYVSVSDRASRHLLLTLALDPRTGAGVVEAASPVEERVIHLSVDRDGRHLVLAHPADGRLSIASVHPDGRINTLPALPGLDVGYFAHQAKLDPEGRGLVACVMGWDAQAGAPERRGRLVAFRYEAGVLRRTGVADFAAGRGPRHLDYAHGRVYVAVERGNRLAVYDYAGGILDPAPRFDVPTLAAPAAARPGQRAGAVHFHPNRRWLYVTNRGGDVNDIALFAVDERTGEPVAAGHFPSDGAEPRTFTIDPTGAFLIVANHSAPRCWVVFRIGGDGRLEPVHRYPRTADLFWIGSAPGAAASS